MIVKKGYHERTIQHSLMWLNGKPEHNHVDGECVADFSCCYPDLFTKDLDKRMKRHQRLLDDVKERRERKPFYAGTTGGW